MHEPAPDPVPTAHEATLSIPHDHPAFNGHFEGFALLPGVALLAETLECALDIPALAHMIGTSPRISNVKFLAPVRPGASLRITLQPTAEGRLRFALHEGERAVASGLLEAGAP
jgi:3-hydroxymyristoyl/3-hydroxydecanoyl-(acyl carrier protein) dehydratase